VTAAKFSGLATASSFSERDRVPAIDFADALRGMLAEKGAGVICLASMDCRTTIDAINAYHADNNKPHAPDASCSPESARHLG